MAAMISADDRVVPDGAMRDFAHVLGIFANAILNGMSDLAERVAVMLVLGQNGRSSEHSRPQDECRGQAALNSVQFHRTLFLVLKYRCFASP